MEDQHLRKIISELELYFQLNITTDTNALTENATTHSCNCVMSVLKRLITV